jgi:hypothetical protein
VDECENPPVAKKRRARGWQVRDPAELERREQRREMIAGARASATTVTRDELRKDAAEWAERTAVEQGLPRRVMDIGVLRDVMRLMGLLKDEQPPAE